MEKEVALLEETKLPSVLVAAVTKQTAIAKTGGKVSFSVEDFECSLMLVPKRKWHRGMSKPNNNLKEFSLLIQQTGEKLRAVRFLHP